jgi:hypothetical protein
MQKKELENTPPTAHEVVVFPGFAWVRNNATVFLFGLDYKSKQVKCNRV